MSAQLAKAAQAVIDRWDSPKWEWTKQGPTADLIADLRKELAAFEAAPQQEPVAWMWQHDETGRTGFVEAGFDRNHWEEHNPRLKIISQLYAAPQQAQAPGWQDIATAPKDGTRILLWWDGLVREGWCGGAGMSRDGGDWWCSHSLSVCNGRPTHWMPFPAAPQQGSKS